MKLSINNSTMGSHQSTHWCSSRMVINVPPLHHIRHKIIYIFSWWWRHLWSLERPPTPNWCSLLPEKISLSGSFSVSAYGTSLHTTNQLCGSVKTAPFKSMVHQEGSLSQCEEYWRERRQLWPTVTHHLGRNEVNLSPSAHGISSSVLGSPVGLLYWPKYEALVEYLEWKT